MKDVFRPSMGYGQPGQTTSESDQGMVVLLLGRPRILRNGEDVTRLLKYRKGIAVLGYLAAQPGAWVSREQLADLLWPDFEIGAARTNLRQVLNNLNAVLAAESADALQKDGAAVSFSSHAGIRTDIELMSDEVLHRVVSDIPENRRWREREVEPWTSVLVGEFLDGLQLPGTPEFDEWLDAKRVQFRARAGLLLESLCRAQRSEGRLAEAAVNARRLVSLSPFEEKHNLLLMSLLAESGDAAGAVEVFNVLQQRLRTEMGIPPGERLVTLRDELLRYLNKHAAPTAFRNTATAELRHVAALYCTSDMLHGDQPDNDFAEQVASVIQQRGGMPVSSVGRGLLAVFGLGATAERATQRAVLAASDLLAPMSATAVIGLRIGISAGQVMLRQTAGMPQLVGETPDLAKLIGWSAQPGEILASEAVALQMADLFRFELAGEQAFNSFDGTHKLYRLAGQAESASTGNIPFYGRDEEMARLREWWHEAASGRERIVVLRAPAGLGKTRLGSELMRWVMEQGGRVRRIRCSLEHQHQPLAAVLAEMGRELDADVQVSASKSAVFEALIELLQAESAQTPTLLLVDDLHWSDLATRELLGQLVRGLGSHRLLVVLTTRPEIGLEYPQDITHIVDLAPLDEGASLSMIAAYDPDNAIPATERAQLAGICAGIPFFIEHQVRSRLEGGHCRLSITELLQSELDRLGEKKSVLHAAAVLGNHFERRHLAALLPDMDVAAALARAAGRRLIDTLSAGSCSFCHALIRDAAYETLTPRRRKLLHERAARLLMREEGIAPEEIAQHLSAAGCRDEALEWWVKAGDGAMAREFAADALASFRNALNLLEDSGTFADESLERSVRMRLGYAAQVAEGYGSPLTYQLFADMASEIESIPDYDSSQLFAALSGCYMGSSSFGKDQGIIIACRLHDLARTDAERLMACFALGNTLFWRGDFNEAADWQKRGIALAANLPVSDRIRYGVDDPAVTCRAFQCWTLWFLGEDAAACAMAGEAVAVARRSKRIHGLCFALIFSASVHRCRGDIAKVIALAGEALALARQYRFPLWEGVSSLYLLWGQAVSGNMADVRDLFGAAAMLQQAIPGRIMTARWIVVHALLACEEWEEGEKLLDTALREVEFQEEQYCLPDLLWLKGGCLENRGLSDEARDYRCRAVELARRQGAIGMLKRFGMPD